MTLPICVIINQNFLSRLLSGSLCAPHTGGSIALGYTREGVTELRSR